MRETASKVRRAESTIFLRGANRVEGGHSDLLGCPLHRTALPPMRSLDEPDLLLIG